MILQTPWRHHKIKESDRNCTWPCKLHLDFPIMLEVFGQKCFTKCSKATYSGAIP